MRKSKSIILAMSVLALFSCQTEDLTIDENTSVVNISDTEEHAWKNYKVDPTSPKNAQPTIKKGEFVSKEGKTAAQWNFLWSDEFSGSNYSNPSSNYWTEQYTPWGNNGSGTRGLNGRDLNIKWWGWRPEQTFLYGGALILQSEKTANNILVCGSANTAGKISIKYGWLEASISAQNPAYGSHTAFWLQSPNQISGAGGGNNTASDGAEIDIFESVYVNTRVQSVVHYDGYGSNADRKTLYWFAEGQDGATYRKYALHWWASGMDVYYEGTLKAQFRGNHVSNTYEYLWLSNGAAFDRNHPNSGANGFTSRPVGSRHWSWVDYVRVWQYY
ncbi:hypothetical protein ACKGJY_02135 [Hyunsoonleella sp. 2307UL5-6]|uniref:glycoside hydrolase family 16 protein n=1 Tax=Hyunsoonleella sp. 2307UL5-6 TaxID=3384768 RepID=UPI0039BCF56E